MITYTLNQFGLRDIDLQYLINMFSEIEEIEKVILYGSRAAGNFERGSDIDLAIFGGNLLSKHIAEIKYKLENKSPTLLKFDIVHFDNLTNELLKENIEKFGEVIYER